jgi:hypothetical protein
VVQVHLGPPKSHLTRDFTLRTQWTGLFTSALRAAASVVSSCIDMAFTRAFTDEDQLMTSAVLGQRSREDAYANLPWLGVSLMALIWCD